MLQSPWMLLGLLGLFAIFLAHRLFRQPAPPLPLSSIRLLGQSSQLPVMPKQWQDLGLMTIRALFWILFALALAKPHCATQHEVNVHAAPHAALILLDANARTHHEVQGQSLWQHQLDKAQKIVEALPDQSYITLMALEPGLTTLKPGYDKQQALSLLKSFASPPFARQSSLSLAKVRPAIDAALESAPAQLERVGYFVAESGPLGLTQCPKDSAQTWICVPAFVSQPNAARPRQFAITKLTQSSRKALGQKTVQVVATIQNLGATEGVKRPEQISWHIDGKRVGSQPILWQNEQGSATWVYGMKDSTPLRLEAKLEDSDSFALDNTQSRWIQSPQPLRVLLVDGDPSEQREHDEVYLLATALKHAMPGQEVQVRGIDPAAFHELLTAQTAPPEDVDVLVMANVVAPSKEDATRLTSWVKQGLGLWITAGARVDAQGYNQRLNKLLPLLLRPGSVSAKEALTLSPEPDHPLSSKVADPQSLVGQGTRRIFLLEPDPDRQAKIALSFSNGAPALVTRSVGAGKVAFWSTSIDRAWTELPLRPAFVPLCRAVVTWLWAKGAQSSAPTQVYVGQSASLNPGQSHRIEGPEGPRTMNAGQDFVPLRIGLYRITQDKAPGSRGLSAILHPKESIPPQGEAKGSQHSDRAKAQHTSTSYRPAWQPLWVLIALALLFETFLRVRRARAAEPRSR